MLIHEEKYYHVRIEPEEWDTIISTYVGHGELH